MTYQLGIDLGTTFTAAAVCRAGGGEPEVVTLGTRNATIPSVLFLGADAAVLVGEAAERRAVTDPDRVVREFKRRIGDPTPIVVGGRAWPAQELSARLVRWVVDRVAEREGGPAARIALTHPAAWGAHKKELLGAALAGQGVSVTFLPEPSAAAVAYAANQRVEPDSTIAVYDLGGGTFDAAVVRKAGTGFELLGRPEGIERLGGIDFDQAVFDHVRAGVPGAFDALDETDPAVLAAVARVRRECTDAKEALSSDTETNIPVLLPGSRGSVRMHRSEFEALIRGPIEETVAALRGAVASAGRTPEQLTAVLLVGGSSRIPLVAQTVSEQLGRPVAVDTDPKNAIAKGAALAVSPQPVAARAAGVGVGAAGVGAGGVGAAVGLAQVGGAARPAGSGAATGLAAAATPVVPPVPARPPQVPLPTSRPAERNGTPPGGIRPTGSGTGQAAAPAPRRPAPQYREPVPEPAAARPNTALYVGIGGLVILVAAIVALLASMSGPSTDVPTSGVTPETTQASQPQRAPSSNRNPGGATTSPTSPPTSTVAPTSTTPKPPPTSSAPPSTTPIVPIPATSAGP